MIQDGVTQISRLHLDGRVLTVRQNRAQPVARENSWAYTDAAGHEHAYGAPGNPYPTLARVSTDRYGCDTCYDEIERYQLVCRQCREVIWPGLSGPGTEQATRSFDYLLDGAPVIQARARELIEQLHEMDPDRWQRVYSWLRRNGLVVQRGVHQ
jgi:hypothetical protein